jgi:hypothetical protein
VLEAAKAEHFQCYGPGTFWYEADARGEVAEWKRVRWPPECDRYKVPLGLCTRWTKPEDRAATRRPATGGEHPAPAADWRVSLPNQVSRSGASSPDGVPSCSASSRAAESQSAADRIVAAHTPEDRHLPAAQLIPDAIEKAFPCPWAAPIRAPGLTSGKRSL